MRITGGQARGIPLQLPKGDRVRPATDALRQAVFSSLAARVEGARFWDLFAGSGAYGLEAFSRGAAGGIFVEKDARVAACLRTNAVAVAKSAGRGADALAVVQGDAAARLPGGPPPDLIFIDPPYEMIPQVTPRLFAALAGAASAAADPLIVFEMPGGIEVPSPGWECVKQIGKGERQPTARIFRASRAAP